MKDAYLDKIKDIVKGLCYLLNFTDREGELLDPLYVLEWSNNCHIHHISRVQEVVQHNISTLLKTNNADCWRVIGFGTYEQCSKYSDEIYKIQKEIKKIEDEE